MPTVTGPVPLRAESQLLRLALLPTQKRRVDPQASKGQLLVVVQRDDSLRGVSLCRELVIKQRLIELHKGTLPLPDGRNSSAILPLIAGYVGAFFSTVSVAMYEVRLSSVLPCMRYVFLQHCRV